MAVPTVPANLASGAVYPESFADDVRDLLAFLRDDRPILRVSAPNASLSSGATHDLDLSDAATYNVGGWTDTSTTYDGWNVPETGMYCVTVLATFAANATGYRAVTMSDEGASAVHIRSIAATAGTGSGTRMTATGLHYFTAGDEVGVEVIQNSGIALDISGWLMAHWVGSSSS